MEEEDEVDENAVATNNYTIDSIARRENEIAQISVILTDSFTETQYPLTKQRTTVSTRKVKDALTWLKKFNVLNKDISLDDDCAIPHVVECHKIERDSHSNIETAFEISAVFSDCNGPLDINGGCNTV